MIWGKMSYLWIINKSFMIDQRLDKNKNCNTTKKTCLNTPTNELERDIKLNRKYLCVCLKRMAYLVVQRRKIWSKWRKSRYGPPGAHQYSPICVWAGYALHVNLMQNKTCFIVFLAQQQNVNFFLTTWQSHFNSSGRTTRCYSSPLQTPHLSHTNH